MVVLAKYLVTRVVILSP